MKFTWDRKKNIVNIKKHRIDFEEAKTVFGDENAVMIADPDHSQDEDRFVMLGFSAKLNILTVCFCERQQDEIRIFSARKANKKETKLYKERL